MNKRNIEIFGMRNMGNQRFQRKHVTMGVIAVLVVLIGLKLFLSGSSGTVSTTGATAITVPQKVQTQEAVVDSEEDIVEEPVEQEKHPLEYGDCAGDIIRRMDDVADVKSYKTDHENRYKGLQAAYDEAKQEYEDKLAALKTEYEPQITRLEQKIKEDEADLARVEERLENLKAQCGN